MDSVTLNLVNFALDMHSVKQSVASKNIANADFKNQLVTDFSEHLARIESLPADKKLEYLKVLNSGGLAKQDGVVRQTDNPISIEQEHANSTTAMLEYQALIEALNRKMGMMALVTGGQR